MESNALRAEMNTVRAENKSLTVGDLFFARSVDQRHQDEVRDLNQRLADLTTESDVSIPLPCSVRGG